MSQFSFNPAIHLSIAWGVTLAIITLVEWNSLDRDPLREQIFIPFIQREISVNLETDDAVPKIEFDVPVSANRQPAAAIDYRVKFHFDGPLFLACFFIPVLVFHGIGWAMGRSR